MVASAISAEILIIGGGLAGLPLALALGRAGIATVVIDREDPRKMRGDSFDGRSTALAYGSQQVLAGLGVWDGIAASAEPIREIRVADQNSPWFLHYDHRDLAEPTPLGSIIENQILRRALMTACADHPAITYLAPAEAVTVERGPADIRATLGDGREVRARLVIAADGKKSPLRAAAGIPVLRHRYPQQAITCLVGHERPHRGIAVEHFLPAGPFAILPMTGNRSSIVWTERASLVPGLMALDDDRFKNELAQRFGDYLGEISLIGPRWSYPLQVIQAEKMIAPRLALIGEAAHVIHPIAGQGLNLGIRDVAALAELIVDACRLGLDPGTPDLLVRYQRWRRFDSVTLAAVTDGLNRLFSNDLAPIRLGRDAGLLLVNALPPLKRVLMRHAMGMLGSLPRLVRGEAL